MIELLPESTDTSFGFKISGKVTAEDYDTMLPILDEGIAAHGRVNLLILMEDFEGAGLDAVKPDFHFGTHQYRQVDKAAFVSEKKWMERLVKIMDPFTRRTKEKSFDPGQLEEAWNWILGEKGEN